MLPLEGRAVSQISIANEESAVDLGIDRRHFAPSVASRIVPSYPTARRNHPWRQDQLARNHTSSGPVLANTRNRNTRAPARPNNSGKSAPAHSYRLQQVDAISTGRPNEEIQQLLAQQPIRKRCLIHSLEPNLCPLLFPLLLSILSSTQSFIFHGSLEPS